MAQAVEWTFGGKQRSFRLNTRALVRLEREAGLRSFTELLVTPEGQPSAVLMSAGLTATILWCALLWESPELTREQVEEWIDEAGLREAMTKAVEILGAGMETFATPVPQPAAPQSGVGTPPAATPLASA